LTIHSSRLDQVMLLSPSRGIAFGYGLIGENRLDSAEIGPSTEITEVIFFDPSHYEEAFDSGIFSLGAPSLADAKNNIRPWTGYGSFKDKY